MHRIFCSLPASGSPSFRLLSAVCVAPFPFALLRVCRQPLWTVCWDASCIDRATRVAMLPRAVIYKGFLISSVMTQFGNAWQLDSPGKPSGPPGDS